MGFPVNFRAIGAALGRWSGWSSTLSLGRFGLAVGLIVLGLWVGYSLIHRSPAPGWDQIAKETKVQQARADSLQAQLKADSTRWAATFQRLDSVVVKSRATLAWSQKQLAQQRALRARRDTLEAKIQPGDTLVPIGSYAACRDEANSCEARSDSLTALVVSDSAVIGTLQTGRDSMIAHLSRLSAVLDSTQTRDSLEIHRWQKKAHGCRVPLLGISCPTLGPGVVVTVAGGRAVVQPGVALIFPLKL